MSAGYIVARENFKEASSHVSAEKDPVMFNLLYGLQSLTNQIEADFELMKSRLALSNALGEAKKKKRSKLSRAQKKTKSPRKKGAALRR